MYRWLIPIVAVFLLVIPGDLTTGSARACEPDGGDAAIGPKHRMVSPPSYEEKAAQALDAELEGQIVIRPNDARLAAPAVDSSGERHLMPLLAILVLAAPVFSAASVGLYAVRRRR